MKKNFYIFLLLLASCSDARSSNQIKRQNMTGDFIYRKADEHRYIPSQPQRKPPPKYPWQTAPHESK